MGIPDLCRLRIMKLSIAFSQAVVASPSKPRGVFKDISSQLEKSDRSQRDYRVKFAARSSLVAQLGGIRATSNVNLELLDSSKRLVAASRRLVNRPERIEQANLAPGTYYLRAVLARGELSRFRLRAFTTPISDTGNTASSAQFVGLLAPTTVGEFIGGEDRADVYAVTVGATGSPTEQLNLALTGETSEFLDGSVTVKLRNSNFSLIRERSGRASFNLSEPLAAGTYFVEVAPTNLKDETNYRLTLSTTPIPDLAGNSPAAARSVELSAQSSLFQDFIGVGDSQDYYRFTIPKSKFSLQLTGPNGNLLNGDVTVRLRDQVNNLLEQESASGGAGSSFSQSLAAGTYTIQLTTASKSVNYSLLLSAEPR